MAYKRNLLGISAIVLIFGLFLIGCDDGSSGNNQNVTLVCLGDSLTAGYGATTPGIDDKSKSYPAFLQEKINIPVVNAGVSGDTTAQALSRMDNDVLSKNPQIIIILLGANDLFKGIPVTTTQENLQSIINKADNGKRKIYLAKFYTEDIAKQLGNIISIFYNTEPEEIVNQYDTMFNTLATLNNVTLIDDIWQGVWGMNMSDFIHPNAAGYEIMADNIFIVLEPYLQASGFLK